MAELRRYCELAAADGDGEAAELAEECRRCERELDSASRMLAGLVRDVGRRHAEEHRLRDTDSARDSAARERRRSA